LVLERRETAAILTQQFRKGKKNGRRRPSRAYKAVSDSRRRQDWPRYVVDMVERAVLAQCAEPAIVDASLDSETGGRS